MMFYLGNFLFFLSSSVAVELADYLSRNQNDGNSIVMLTFCLILAFVGFLIAWKTMRLVHENTALGKSLGIAMIVTAILSLITEEDYACLPAVLLFETYLIPGLLIYRYNRGANRKAFKKLGDSIVAFLKERLEYQRKLFTPEVVYERQTVVKKETLSLDEIILNLNLAYRIFDVQDQIRLKENLKKTQLYLIEMRKYGSEVLGPYKYLLKEINNLSISYIEIMSQYIQVDESKEILGKLDDAFAMITTALENIYGNYLRAKAFDIEVGIKALELQLGEEGLLQPKFKTFE